MSRKPSVQLDANTTIELGTVGDAVAVTNQAHNDAPPNWDGGQNVETSIEAPQMDDPEAKAFLDRFVAAYVAWFVLLRLVDFYYIFTADGRFPEGLESLYPSDADRLQTVGYVHWVLTISIVRQSVIFGAVMVLVRTKAAALLDQRLRPLLKLADERCCCCCHIPCDSFASNVCGWCPCRPVWGRLSRGALFLAIWALAFAILAVPFQLWAYKLSADYGFANTLTMPVSTQVSTALRGLPMSLVTNYLYFYVLLLILGAQGKVNPYALFAGWCLFMFAMLTIQFNPEILALLMGGRSFPTHDFGVGNGFPLVQGDSGSGMVPLNRIYWPEVYSSGWRYSTHDRSRGGELKLRESNGFYRISRDGQIAAPGTALPAQDLAQTREGNGNAFYSPLPEGIDELSWQTGSVASGFTDAPHAYMSVRHGKEIRERLMSFARAHDISISEIYMIDGSSSSTLANAFAAGLGDSKVIGLYDTLFLGDNASRGDAAALPDALRPLEPPGLEAVRQHEGQVPMLSLLAQAEGVDTSEDHQEPVLHSHTSRAMTSGEILGILGHELGHSALGHNFRGVFVNGFTTAVSLFTMGFCLWNPKITAALGADPSSMLHVGYLFYTHVAGSLLDGLLGIVTNAITRSQEYAADAYSAEVSEEYATDLQTGLAKLTVNSNVDPDEPWLYEFLHRDHPTMAHRWSAIQSIKDSRYRNSSDLSLKASAADEQIVTV